MATIQLVRATVQGTVYLIEPIKGHVYTYNPSAPLFVGVLEKCTDKQMKSKADGCLSEACVKVRPDLKEALATALSSHTIPGLPPS
jgi:hypothetical protein